MSRAQHDFGLSESGQRIHYEDCAACLEAAAPTSITSLRKSIGMTREQLADVLAVDRTTVWRWESGETPIPAAVPLALLWIRHCRRDTMQGNNYPLMVDVHALMLNEDIDQDTAVRSFGAAP